MKAMILAAGKGERMRPLTLSTPKPLLPVGGKPLIAYHLERLREAGFHEVVINHAWLGEQIEEALGDGRDFGLSITYSPEGEPLETAGGIVKAMPLLTSQNEEWFLVINGDIWCDFDFKSLTPPDHADALLVLTENPDHNPEGDFHLDSDGFVKSEGARKLTFAGISLLHRRLFDGLSSAPSRLAPILRSAMENRRVTGVYHSGRWMDIGTPERLRDLDQTLSANRA